MLLACSWSVLSFGPLARWPFASAQGRIRCPTLAPRAPPRDRVQKGKGLQLSQAAAQAITVVILWLTQHFGAHPPTSRKCYRSTATTRMILSMLLVSFFLPLPCPPVVSHGAPLPPVVPRGFLLRFFMSWLLLWWCFPWSHVAPHSISWYPVVVPHVLVGYLVLAFCLP